MEQFFPVSEQNQLSRSWNKAIAMHSIVIRCWACNNRIKEEKQEDTMIFSMDVDALFPSLALQDILDTTMELFLETELEVKVEDDKVLAQYLSIMVSREELEERGGGRKTRVKKYQKI